MQKSHKLCTTTASLNESKLSEISTLSQIILYYVWIQYVTFTIDGDTFLKYYNHSVSVGQIANDDICHWHNANIVCGHEDRKIYDPEPLVIMHCLS